MSTRPDASSVVMLLLCNPHQGQWASLLYHSLVPIHWAYSRARVNLAFHSCVQRGHSPSLKLYSIEAHPTMLCHPLTLSTSSSVDTWVIPPLSWISNPIQLSSSTIIIFCFQGKPFNITVIQAYAPISNAEEAEVEWFYEDLQKNGHISQPRLRTIPIVILSLTPCILGSPGTHPEPTSLFVSLYKLPLPIGMVLPTNSPAAGFSPVNTQQRAELPRASFPVAPGGAYLIPSRQICRPSRAATSPTWLLSIWNLAGPMRAKPWMKNTRWISQM